MNHMSWRHDLPLFSHNDTKKLILQTLGCDHEVQQRHFGGDLW